MKTTIKLTTTKSLIVEPYRKSDLVAMMIQQGGLIIKTIYLTPDQVGALMFGLEQASPETIAARIKREFDAECM